MNHTIELKTTYDDQFDFVSKIEKMDSKLLNKETIITIVDLALSVRLLETKDRRQNNVTRY